MPTDDESPGPFGCGLLILCLAIILVLFVVGCAVGELLLQLLRHQ